MKIGVSGTMEHTCATLVDTLEANTRLRIPCWSVRGRSVFVRQIKYAPVLKLSEVEVYVRREYDSTNKLRFSLACTTYTQNVFILNIIGYVFYHCNVDLFFHF